MECQHARPDDRAPNLFPPAVPAVGQLCDAWFGDFVDRDPRTSESLTAHLRLVADDITLYVTGYGPEDIMAYPYCPRERAWGFPMLGSRSSLRRWCQIYGHHLRRDETFTPRTLAACRELEAGQR
jgi:hypothetical protein